MCEKEKKKKAVQDIMTNYSQMEQSYVNQLYMRQRLHSPTAGMAREDVWKELFRMILPGKFVLEHSVFIIDSGEGISNEVDLAVIDETYTPYIFHYGRLKFIPIEAVAAVIECKSQSLKPEDIKQWVKSIAGLKTCNESIARMATQIAVGGVMTQEATRPLRILCAMENSQAKNVREEFDFVLLAKEEKREASGEIKEPARIEVIVNPKQGNLMEWFVELNFEKKENFEKAQENIFQENSKMEENKKRGQEQKEILENTALEEYQIKDKPSGRVQGLLSFHFQLNQLLMLINNPLLFPHRKYVEMFNRMEEMTK